MMKKHLKVMLAVLCLMLCMTQPLACVYAEPAELPETEQDTYEAQTEENIDSETVAETEEEMVSVETTEAVEETETAGETEEETETTDIDEAEVLDDPEAYLRESDLFETGDAVEIMGNASGQNKAVKAYGVDVSSWQGKIDWKKVKAAGVDFAMIRVGYRGYAKGTLVTDEYAEANLSGAQQAGIRIGAYFFSTAITEAEGVEEAKYMINIVKKYNITYPLCYDNEGMYLVDEDGDGTPETKQRDYDLTAAQRTKIGIAFLNYCKSQGYEALMYGNTSCFNDNKEFNIEQLEKLYDVWIAAYPWKNNATVGYSSLTELLNEKRVLSYQRPYRIWQFSSEGKVDGISGNADINVEYYSDKEQASGTRGTLDTAYVEGLIEVMVSDVKAPYHVRAVQITVNSEMNGEDDLQWYNTRYNAGIYFTAVDLFEKHKDLGLYTVRVYYVDDQLKKHEVTSRSVRVSNNVKPSVPVTGLAATSTGRNKVTLSWDIHPEAEGYLIYGIRGTEKYSYIGMTTKNTTFTDIRAKSTEYNFYWVFPYSTNINNEMMAGPACPYTYAKGICRWVTNLRCASVQGGVKITWSPSADAEGYLIYGKHGDGTYGYIGMTTKGTTFTDTKALNTDWNFYWVYPYFKENDKMVLNTVCKYSYGKAL